MRVLAVTNMYPTRDHPSCGTFVEQQVKGLREAGAKVRVLHLDRFHHGSRVYYHLGPLLIEAIKQHRPDVIAVMYGGVMARSVTRVSRGCPVIVSFCGSDLLGENYSGLVRKLISRFGILCSFQAARLADGIIVKSRNLRRALPTSIPLEKIEVIPNGVDLKRFKPASRRHSQEVLGWDPDRFHVLFPANTGDPVKRPELAAECVELLRQSGIRAELHFLKKVVHPDVPIWLNGSDALLLTSRQEGSPNIVKEALACNRPVVSVDVGDVSERIEGIEGCHLAAAEPAAIAGKLRLVFDGPRSVNGRVRMEELSLASVSCRILDFYARVLARRSSTPLI